MADTDEPRKLYNSRFFEELDNELLDDYEKGEEELVARIDKKRNASIFRYNSHLLDAMQEGSLKDGRRLREGFNIEIILADDAVWDNGQGPAGSADPQGYTVMNKNVYDDKDLRPANRINARVYKIDLDTGRLILSSSTPSEDVLANTKERPKGYDLHSFYVDSRVIRDYTIFG